MASLSTLDPSFRPYAENFFEFARMVDPRFVITSARRSWWEQMVLFEKFEAKKTFATYIEGTGFIHGFDTPNPERILPALPPWKSKHVQGLAFDMARLNVKPFDDPVLANLGAFWKRIGGDWGPTDPVHFEV